MRKLLLLSMILAFTVSVNAQTEDKKWGFGLGLGAYSTSDQDGVGLMPELYFSRYISPRFDLMLKGDLGVLNSTQDGGVDLADAFLNLRFKLANENKKFRPYLFAGPGYLADNATGGFNFETLIMAEVI